AGLALRLAAATVCVLIVPGALILRAVGWRAFPAVGVAASLAVSLAVGFAALAVTFAVDGSLGVFLAAVAVSAIAALVPATRGGGSDVPRAEWVAFVSIVAAALVFAGIVWWVSDALKTGDALFHAARVRKLAEASALASPESVNEFRDGDLHPGYAFPLWHAELGAIARLAGVDSADVMLHVASALVPVAFLVAYAAGTTLFGSWAGGVAVLAAQVGHLGFSRSGTGSFASLASPASVTRVVLVPALLALVFANVRARRSLDPVPLLAIAAAALAVAAVHPTYVIFTVLLLLGFTLVRVAFSDERRADAVGMGAALAAVVVPTVLLFAWLAPSVSATASHSPSAGEEARALRHYHGQVEVVGDDYRAAPSSLTRAGPVVVAGLLAVPLLALLARRRWAAFVVGGTVLLLALLLVPDLFARLSDLVSVSQSRRLAHFLPIAFAVAGAAVVLGRLRIAGAVVALAAGSGLQLAYGGASAVSEPGPAWPVWFAIVGGVAALCAAVLVARRVEAAAFDPTGWAALAAVAFVLPIGMAGLRGLERVDAADPYALTPGIVEALRDLDSDDVVFAAPETAYRVAAFAPVYVAALPAAHVADTENNRPYRRQRDAIRFFRSRRTTDSERRDLLRRYDADWLLVDLTRRYPRKLVASFPRVYADARFALFRVGS
ncbi:MAG: hypothetical protein M3304_03860, partial [Actinomycetota bacterium]|nr:hypothetical protein [Actinomycetota bacterium]